MSNASEPGIDASPLVDGTDIGFGTQHDIRDTLRQSLDQTMSGAYNLDVPYDGDFLPDQPDLFEAVIDLDIDDSRASTLTFLEGLRTQGGVHDVVFWKAKKYRYTFASGQQVFYLPRPDAFSKSYAGFTNQTKYGLKVTVTPTPGGGQPTVVYKTSVVSTDTPVATELWISNAPVAHPRSGRRVALCKFGTAPGAAATVDVEYHPLFRMFVQGVPTKPFTMIGREDRALYLIEGAK